MALIKWTSPYRDFLNLQEEMNRLFDAFSRGTELQSVTEGSWAPAVDIHESKESIVIDAEVPGVDQKDIKVSITDNILTIQGEKKQQKTVEEENFHRVERFYGTFSRSFNLPAGVKADQIKASFKDGVLKIILPKSEEAKTKIINVEVK
jgi:HSP20 family protein